MKRRSRGSLWYSEKIGEDIARYLAFMSEHSCVPAKSLEVVLHRAGSFQEYPTSLRTKRFISDRKENEIKNISQLLDFGFGEVRAQGIEIDVRTVPGSESLPGVYVVHDAIKENSLDDRAKTYLANNSLLRVLTYFLGREYEISNGQGRGEQAIFIELKVSKRRFRLNSSPLNSAEKDAICRVISEVDQAVRAAGKARAGTRFPAVTKRIAFISFNIYALKFAKDISDSKGHRGRQYFFIAGTDRKILGWSAALLFLRDANYLGQHLINRLREADWLTGIWFDPGGISSMGRLFSQMNRGRRNAVDIYISTYKLREKRFRRRFERETIKNHKKISPHMKKVRGLIFDIRKL